MGRGYRMKDGDPTWVDPLGRIRYNSVVSSGGRGIETGNIVIFLKEFSPRGGGPDWGWGVNTRGYPPGGGRYQAFPVPQQI